jgi:hypothetical protein
MRLLAYFFVALSDMCAAPAFAATVTSLQGQIQVNTGTGFHRVPGTAQVEAGGAVMAGPGGLGQIVYSDGCKVPVRPGAVVVVASASPCARGQDFPALGENAALGYAVGLGAAAAVGAGTYEATSQHNASAPASP